jgi:hypothetical protein
MAIMQRIAGEVWQVGRCAPQAGHFVEPKRFVAQTVQAQE